MNGQPRERLAAITSPTSGIMDMTQRVMLELNLYRATYGNSITKNAGGPMNQISEPNSAKTRP